MKTLKFVLAALLLTGSFSLVACNTVEGAGEDIESGGDAISDTARDIRD